MSRPDVGRLQRQQRKIGGHVGETATWRAYVSASAGTPQYGAGDGATYQDRTVTGLFRAVTPEEVARAGGQYAAGDIRATLLDCTPGRKDEVRWRGVTYRIESDTYPQRLLGSSGQWVLLRRGDATG